MRRSYLFSFLAAFSLAFASLGFADPAVAQDRGAQSVNDDDDRGAATTFVLIAAVVAVILGVVIAVGGDDDRPVSP